MNSKMTKEQALQWLKEVKENKQKSLERMKKIGIDEYTRKTGKQPTYIEVL